ncbi:hypothetical protein NIES4071_104710 (plasmid) [Calothrix sp. NIES-4071]|nr:hypothetical protein NIES4071_104710 [Calothrix sp. NIES-4071]BAZ64889.1 hypothetical protein NIES4105_106220 [Calothrix sp. NIES-4105]
MHNNYNLAVSASAENTAASKIFIDDAWVYEDKYAAKPQPKQTLWISPTSEVPDYLTIFNIRRLGDTSEITPGIHYIIAERHTPEELIKQCGWHLQLVEGAECLVYSVQTSFTGLLTHESSTIQEAILQILEFAQPFEDWVTRIEDQPLSIREAANVARAVIANLPEPAKSIELAALRRRCNEAPYNWNQLITALEAEHQKARESEREHVKRSYDKEPATKESKHLQKLKLIEEKWGASLQFNEALQRLELDGKHLQLDTIKTKIAIEFNIDIAKEDAIDILFYLGASRGYHPVRNYLNQVSVLHANVDTTILDEIATRYFNNSDEIANIYMKKTLIGAVARIMEPGCKFDTITILYGLQGAYKSTFWRKLIGDEVFSDSLVDLVNKDELAKLRRFWGLELAEIDYLFGQKAVESFKRFLSAQEDTYRPPYARENVTVPRTCFFVGTTNKKDILQDPTGNRRYWVLDVRTNRIDYLKLEQERDLLWAAAVKLYHEGAQWDLTEEEKLLSTVSNKDYDSQDVWTDLISNYMSIRQKATTLEVMTEALHIEPSLCDNQKQRRVVSILQRLGYESKTVSRGGAKLRAWVYSPSQGADVTLSYPDVTPDVTAQNESTQDIQTSVTPVTSNNPNFHRKEEIEPTVNSGDLNKNDVTRVTANNENTQNPDDNDVVESNAIVTEGSQAPINYENHSLEIIQANAENIRIALADGELEMIAVLTLYWSDEFKSAVWAQLTDEEVTAIEQLSTDSQ